MLSFMSNLAISLFMSAATLANPTIPKALSFDASAFVTVSNHIRVSINKTDEVPVVVMLRNADNQVIFNQNISKKETKYAVKLNVEQLADGKYELEVKSSEGSIRKQLNVSTRPTEKSNRVIAMQ
ncbi:hypothetical protein M0L20_29130 [Spirosoma sp. RP8]|uniref:DUF3244 domain-containing protein n=1 Tax=Spirosoma liriopis TaxID=2937440 RepID=A0ABT0HWR1_9BACT|nr:hypothetical protein [Spirosoma liriopis]MCK8495965.1 hypothetical protein [Spirosoma liriopis]